MILAGLDAYTTLVDPLWTRTPRAIVDAVTPLTPDSAVVTLRTNRAWPGHRAGQHVTVGVDVDGVRHHRTYTLTAAASAPGRRLVEIAVRRVPGGLLSNVLTDRAAVGTVVHLDGPTGRGVHRPDRPLLLISGGSGVTPTMAVVRTLVATASTAGAPVPDVVVVHHAPTAELTMFGTELARLGAEHDWLTVHLRHTAAGDRRLARDDLDAVCPDWRERRARVCGPAGLVTSVEGWWTEAGIADRLHTDPFDAPAIAAPADAPDAATGIEARSTAVTAAFARSGRSVATTSATTLLEAAESAGVLAPYGCRRGVCHTCTQRLDAGRVTDVVDGRTSDAGTHVRLCVSRPTTDVTVDL